MQVRSLACAITVVALLVAGSAKAAVILELSSPALLNGGLISRTITAKGTAGEIIAGFDGIKIANAHQVWGLGEVATPQIGSFPGFGWNAAWEPYDTHLLVPSSAVLGSVGAALGETNAKGTTGTLGLPQEFGQNAPSGFGTLKSSDGTDGFRLLPELQSSSVPFLYSVASSSGGLSFDVTVAYTRNGNNLSTVFTSFDIGPPPIVAPSVPDLVLPPFGPPIVEMIGTLVDIAPGTYPVTWSNLTGPMYTPGFGAPPSAPGLSPLSQVDWNPLTQQFRFNAFGASRGTYRWMGVATNEFGSDPFTITATLIPEPATATLLGLAVIGLVGCARRRS